MTPQDYLRQAGLKLAVLKECIVHEWGDVWHFTDSMTNRQGKIRRTIKDDEGHNIPEQWTLYWLNDPIYDATQPAKEQSL